MATLSNPTVEVNNSAIGIVPNSFSFKPGKGNKTARPQSAGGDSIAIIISEDAETKKSMVKFAIYNTKANDDLIAAWQSAVDGVAIRASQGDFTKSFRRMHITDEPEQSAGADATWEVTFEGQPAV